MSSYLLLIIILGGIAGKLKGRVSDTALVGCGGYANNKGAAAATGHGEKLIKFNFTRQVVIDMETGSAQVMQNIKNFFVVSMYCILCIIDFFV